MANVIDAEYTPIQGVHILSESSYRKHVRTLPVLTCENCGKRNGQNGIEVKRCQGCWSVGFCSDECQRALWPTHQESCQTLQQVLHLEEMARDFYSDPFLLHYLRVALIAKLGLLSPSYTLPPKRFPSVIVHLHVNPISEEQGMEICTGKIDVMGEDKIPGYLTVGINSEPVSYIPLTGSSNTRNPEHAMMVRAYKEARRDADSNGRSGNPIVMVDFGYNMQLINIGLEITPDAFETARGSPPPKAMIPPSLTALPTPPGVQAVLRMMGQYIKLDQDNKMKLRRDLQTIDKVFLYRKAQYLVHGNGPSSFDGTF